MSHRLAVYVYSADLISQAGTAAQLRGRPEVYVVEQHAIDDAEVAIVVVDRLDDELRRLVGAIQRDGCPRIVVITTDVSTTDADHAVGVPGVSAVLCRAVVTPESLTATIVAVAAGRLDAAATGEVAACPTLSPPSPFDDRERDVLALLAEGYDTQAIADRLYFSERTIKSVIHDITTRLNLRNRAHAVAYAIKSGVV